MKWAAIVGVFFTAFVKFMFAPFAAVNINLDFLTAWIAVFSGGLISAFVFYFASEFFMKRAHSKKVEKIRLAKSTGQEIKMKKNFTWVNKNLVKFKHGIGQKGLCILAPLFLSVPIGSIICAKFFGHQKSTFPLIVFGLAMNSFILCCIAFINQII